MVKKMVVKELAAQRYGSQMEHIPKIKYDPDTMLDEEDYQALLDYREEKKKGLLTPLEQIKKERERNVRR